ncbi:MAG TPA: PEGA domain-containing protein [Prolixibacteraceae bacterium]|nr:PEGA domain-containing protein [Prolixibacteraceae bacterium]HPS12477.1 PEGA domain-containing protein [Prolixibacteraceae bacterium]
MKKFTFKNRTISLILALLVLFSSCASTTLIESVPSGGELYLDGEYVGQTPYSMTDTKIVGSCTSVRIEKKNYENLYASICRTEEADAGAIVGGLFFWFPFLWTMKYKPTHYYKLQLKGENDESLDQLMKGNDNNEKTKSSGSQNIEKNGVIRLDEGNPISTEEFEQQKVSPEKDH